MPGRIAPEYADGPANKFVPVQNTVVEAAGGHVAGHVFIGNGDPNDAVTGDVGDFFVRLDGAPGTLYYLKTSGAATNTGWTAKAVLP